MKCGRGHPFKSTTAPGSAFVCDRVSFFFEAPPKTGGVDLAKVITCVIFDPLDYANCVSFSFFTILFFLFRCGSQHFKE